MPRKQRSHPDHRVRLDLQVEFYDFVAKAGTVGVSGTALNAAMREKHPHWIIRYYRTVLLNRDYIYKDKNSGFYVANSQKHPDPERQKVKDQERRDATLQFLQEHKEDLPPELRQ